MDKNSGLDALSRELIRTLMRTDNFQELWARSALTHWAKERLMSPARKHVLFEGNIYQDEYKEKAALKRHSSYRELLLVKFEFYRLIQALNIAEATFKNGIQMARYECRTKSSMSSRDTIALYALHVRLEQFCALKSFRLDRFGALSRQLTTLIGSFTKYVSDIYSIEKSLFMANSLYHLLTRFYQCTLTHFQHKTNVFAFPSNVTALNAIEEFGLVRKTLEKMIELKTAKAVRRISLPISGIDCTAGRFHLNRSSSLQHLDPVLVNGKITSVPFVKSVDSKKQPSFLLSPELVYNRRLMDFYRQKKESQKLVGESSIN